MVSQRTRSPPFPRARPRAIPPPPPHDVGPRGGRVRPGHPPLVRRAAGSRARQRRVGREVAARGVVLRHDGVGDRGGPEPAREAREARETHGGVPAPVGPVRARRAGAHAEARAAERASARRAPIIATRRGAARDFLPRTHARTREEKRKRRGPPAPPPPSSRVRARSSPPPDPPDLPHLAPIRARSSPARTTRTTSTPCAARACASSRI